MKEIYIKQLRDYMESRKMPDYTKIKQVRLWNYYYLKNEIIHFKSRMGQFLYIVSTKEKESIQLAFSALSQYGFTDDLQYYPISVEFQNGDVVVTSDKTCETLWDLVCDKHFIVKIENDFVYAFDLQSSMLKPGKTFKDAYVKLLEYANLGKLIEASMFLKFKPKIRLIQVNPDCNISTSVNTIHRLANGLVISPI